MRLLLSSAALALALTACGSSEDGQDSDAADASVSSETTTSSAAPTGTADSPEPEGESTDCLLSATKFADRAGDHALSFATTAPALGEQEKLEDLDDLLSEISVLCSDSVDELAKEIMVPLTKANYEISLCAFDPDPAFGGCRRAQNDKVHKLGERAAGLVGQLRNSIDE